MTLSLAILGAPSPAFFRNKLLGSLITLSAWERLSGSTSQRHSLRSSVRAPHKEVQRPTGASARHPTISSARFYRVRTVSLMAPRPTGAPTTAPDTMAKQHSRAPSELSYGSIHVGSNGGSERSIDPHRDAVVVVVLTQPRKSLDPSIAVHSHFLHVD